MSACNSFLIEINKWSDRFDNISAFEESIFPAIPERQVSFTVRNEEIVIKWVEGCSC